MRIDLQGKPLGRPVDEVDLSDATTATRTGPAVWLEDGVLDLPFDRDLTDTELEQVRLRLVATSPDDVPRRERLQAALDANDTFLDVADPTTAQKAAQLEALTRQTNDLIRLALGLPES